MIKFKVFRVSGLGILNRNPYDILINGEEDYENIYARFKENLLAHTFEVTIEDLTCNKLNIFPTDKILKPMGNQAENFLDHQLGNFNRPEAERLLDRLKSDLKKEEKNSRPWDEDAEKYKHQPSLSRFYAIQSILPIIEKYLVKKPQCKKVPFVFDQKFSEQIADVLINEVDQDRENLEALNRFVENTLIEGERVNFVGKAGSLCYFFFHLEKFGKLQFSGDLKIQKAIRTTFLFDGEEPTGYIDKLFKVSAGLERTPQHVSNELGKNNPHANERLLQLGFPVPSLK
jgi:hypothetical protein